MVPDPRNDLEEDDKPRCFFIAKFGNPESPERKRYESVIRDAISPACDECGYVVTEMALGGNMNDMPVEIWDYLAECQLAIADITDFPPNVMYELGARIAMNLPTIIIKEGPPSEKPFDAISLRVFPFDLINLEALKVKLVDRIKSSVGDPSVLTTNFLREMSFARTLSDEHRVFKFLNKQKSLEQDKYIALWCFNQRNADAFKNYYTKEQKVLKVPCLKERLINTSSVNRELIIDHVKLFKDDIINNNYRIVSTDHFGYAFNLFARKSQNLLVLLLPDNADHDTIDLAVYSENNKFFNLLKSKYGKLESLGVKLHLNKSDTTDTQIEQKVNEWIDRSRAKFQFLKLLDLLMDKYKELEYKKPERSGAPLKSRKTKRDVKIKQKIDQWVKMVTVQIYNSKEWSEFVESES